MKKVTALLLVAMCLLGAVAIHAQEDDEFDEDVVVDSFDADMDEGADDLGVAHCILHKEIVADEDRVVEGKDFTVTYTVFSIGSTPCDDVSVRETVAAGDFDVIDGSTDQFWEAIAPEASESFNVTLRPKTAGVWTPSRAVLEYRDSALSEDKVLTPAQFARETANFALEWGVFAAMLLVAVGLPFQTWRSTAGTEKKTK